MNRRKSYLVIFIMIFVLLGWSFYVRMSEEMAQANTFAQEGMEIPVYDNGTFSVLNENQPDFSAEDFKPVSFESYGKLDGLGRCTAAFACVGKDLMPEGKMDPIGAIRPSGWQTVKYNDYIDGNYLYNRCHLIGYQMTGESANERNLITGTRWMNVQGMLPFENLVARYVKAFDRHVLYRVTPVFEGRDLVARGVQIEAASVEDGAQDICLNVFVFNVQPGISIDYKSGNNELSENPKDEIEIASQFDAYTVLDEMMCYGLETSGQYVVNDFSHRFHKPQCQNALLTSNRNKLLFTGSREELMELGFQRCQKCWP